MAVLAQLKADFVADKTGGCSPFSISFTNSTSGASASAVYNWNFDNGNRSLLKNTRAIFQEEKNYKVSLAVTDIGKTSVKTQIISVFKKPVVNFISSIQKGCAPFAVTFSSSATATDGSVTAYFWDFGDGTTSVELEPQHTFVPGYYGVRLQYITTKGCKDYGYYTQITVSPKLHAEFVAISNTITCGNTYVMFKKSETNNNSYWIV